MMKSKNENSEKQKPAFTKRIGAVKCSVFENSAESGRVFSNISLVRRYKTNGGEWNETHVLSGEADLLAAMRCLQLALDFIQSREVEFDVEEEK